MKLSLSVIVVMSCICLSLAVNIADVYAELKLGILAKRGAKRVVEQWGPTAEYLSEKMGENVVVIPIDFKLVDFMVRNARIDFLLANPAFFVEIEKRYNVEAVGTMINSVRGKPCDSFAGVIFVRSDSNIRDVDGLKGKRMMLVETSSFGGGQMAWRLMLENNIDPLYDLATLQEGGTHDMVVYAVKNGSVDVGTVRSDTLERMDAEGKIKLADFRILHQINDDFPCVHSTRLYPEWPMSAMAHVSSKVRSKMARALCELGPAEPAARAAQIMGWKEPADYSSVRECLKTTGYSCFTVSPEMR